MKMTKNQFGALIALLLMAAAPIAEAQQAPPPSSGRPQTARERAWDIYEAAQFAARNGEPLRAATLFLEANALRPNCALVFNAAASFEVARRPQEALDQYRRYLEAAEAPGGGRQCLDVAPARASIQRIEQALRAPSAPTRPPPPPALIAIAPPPRAAPPVRYREERASPRAASYALWAGGGAVAGFGIYSLAMWIRNASAADDPTVADPDRHARAASGAAVGTITSLVIGGAAIGVGTWLYLRQPPRRIPIVAVSADARSVSVSAAVSF